MEVGSPATNGEGTFSLGETSDETLYRAATEDEFVRIVTVMEWGLAAGGLGFGFGLSYTPGVNHGELLRLFGVAADHDVLVYIHLRSAAEFRRGGRVHVIAVGLQRQDLRVERGWRHLRHQGGQRVRGVGNELAW